MTSFPEKKRRRLPAACQKVEHCQGGTFTHTIASESVNGSKHALKVHIIVRSVQRREIRSVERVLRSIGVKSKIDARIIQHFHRLIVVLAVIDRVDSDRVDSQLLEALNVARESFGVQERIRRVRSTSRLVCHSADVKSLAIGPERVAFCGDGGKAAGLSWDDAAGDSGRQTGDCQRGAGEGESHRRSAFEVI